MSSKTEIPFSIKQHYEETIEIWDSYRSGKPIRVPMMIGASTRYFIFNEALNSEGLTFREYLNDASIMMDFQIKLNKWARENIICDMMPFVSYEENKIDLWVEFQNLAEASWFGCPINYFDNYEPNTIPILDDQNKNMLFHKGIPDPFSGIMGKIKDYYEQFLQKADDLKKSGVNAEVHPLAGMSVDGPLTIACELRGTTQFCMDLALDPEYALELLDYITEATIIRIMEWRKYTGHYAGYTYFSFADDSIELISCEMYRELILPFHRRLCEKLSAPDAFRAIHLCGDASRHFTMIHDELNVRSFDTGFPIDLGKICLELGPDVTVYGGPDISFLKLSTREEIFTEVHRIMDSGVKNNGKFVLREANNLAPYTPLENINAMYEACRLFGKY